jgi:hypothetical protein
MPPKKTTKTETEVAAPAPAPAVEDKKPKKSASNKKEESAPAPAPAPAVNKKTEKKTESKKSESKKSESKKVEKVEKAPVEKAPKVKRNVDKQSVHSDFLALEQNFKDTLKSLPTESRRALGDIFRRFVDLRKDSTKVMGIKSKRQNSGNGGFKKEVKISDALSKFCSANSASVLKWIQSDITKGKSEGKPSKWESKDVSSFSNWDVNGGHGRDKVTNFMCAYVADKQLQIPNNRKYLKFDTPLQQLFGLKFADRDNNGEPLTYCSIQSFLTQHYPEALAQKKIKEAEKAAKAQAKAQESK